MDIGGPILGAMLTAFAAVGALAFRNNEKWPAFYRFACYLLIGGGWSAVVACETLAFASYFPGAVERATIVTAACAGIAIVLFFLLLAANWLRRS